MPEIAIDLLITLIVVAWCFGGVILFDKFEKGVQAKVAEEDKLKFDHVELDGKKPKHLLFLFLCGPFVWLVGTVMNFKETCEIFTRRRKGKKTLASRFMTWLLEDHDSRLRKL